MILEASGNLKQFCESLHPSFIGLEFCLIPRLRTFPVCHLIYCTKQRLHVKSYLNIYLFRHPLLTNRFMSPSIHGHLARCPPDQIIPCTHRIVALAVLWQVSLPLKNVVHILTALMIITTEDTIYYNNCLGKLSACCFFLTNNDGAVIYANIAHLNLISISKNKFTFVGPSQSASRIGLNKEQEVDSLTDMLVQGLDNPSRDLDQEDVYGICVKCGEKVLLGLWVVLIITVWFDR